MTAYACTRGHKIEFDEASGQWRYADTGEVAVMKSGEFGAERPCRYCYLMPTPEGHDACLGELPGVKYACCGHGIEGEGYISYERWPFWMTNKNRWPMVIEAIGLLLLFISSGWMIRKGVNFDSLGQWGVHLILSGCIGLFARWVGRKQAETAEFLCQRRHEALIKSLEA